MYRLYNGDCLEVMDRLIEEYPTYQLIFIDFNLNIWYNYIEVII